MVHDVSSSALGGSDGAFDFNSQAGVLSVLGAIRVSNLSVVDKNELRDLVFQYSNGGGDLAVRNILEDRLRTFSITPDLITATNKKNLGSDKVKVETKSNTTPGFFAGRPIPVFSASPITDQIVSAIKPLEQKATPVPESKTQFLSTPPEKAQELVNKIVVNSVRPNETVIAADMPSEVLPPVRPVVNIPVVKIIPNLTNGPITAPVTPVTITEPISTPELIVSATEPVVNPASPVNNEISEARMNKIRSIKTDINNRVGNPVNLVDMDNVIGREYMTSLLEAMKLLSSASVEESDRAMARLENIYEIAVALIESKKAPVEVIVPVIPNIDSLPTNLARVEPITPQAITSKPVISRVSVVSPSFPERSGYENQELGQAEILSAPKSEMISVAKSVIPTVAEVPSYQTQPRPLQSVAASQAPLRQITELPTDDEVRNSSVSGDPLYTKAIDDGLEQLLSEWSLFKKSGLFGTGPSGRNHPLFLKLASLQIPLILAGRFDGSTQEIKQSITDYMNGWRYEQGIVYEKGEAFEQYLRRVIKHIIDLQNRKRQS